MGLETPTDIATLNPLWPLTSDPRSEGDDHIRNLKIALQACFPSLSGRLGSIQSKNANYTPVVTDFGRAIKCTAALTLALTAAATLGNGWFIYLYVDAAGGTVVIDPNSSETVQGATTFNMYPGDEAVLLCDGSNFTLRFLNNGPVRIARVTLSAASTAAFTGLTGFSHFEWHLNNLFRSSGSGGGDIASMRASLDNGSNWLAANYKYCYNYITAGSGTEQSVVNASDTSIALASYGQAAGTLNGKVSCGDLSVSRRKPFQWLLSGDGTGNSIDITKGAGEYNGGPDALNAVQFNFSGATTGVIDCYGWR